MKVAGPHPLDDLAPDVLSPRTRRLLFFSFLAFGAIAILCAGILIGFMVSINTVMEVLKP